MALERLQRCHEIKLQHRGAGGGLLDQLLADRQQLLGLEGVGQAEHRLVVVERPQLLLQQQPQLQHLQNQLLLQRLLAQPLLLQQQKFWLKRMSMQARLLVLVVMAALPKAMH